MIQFLRQIFATSVPKITKANFQATLFLLLLAGQVGNLWACQALLFHTSSAYYQNHSPLNHVQGSSRMSTTIPNKSVAIFCHWASPANRSPPRVQHYTEATGLKPPRGQKRWLKKEAIEVGQTNPSTSTEIIALYGFYSLGLRTRRAQVWTNQIQISEHHSKVLSQNAWIPPEQACGRLKYASSSSIYWSLAIPLWGSLADQGCSQSFQTSVHKKPWGVGMDVTFMKFKIICLDGACFQVGSWDLCRRHGGLSVSEIKSMPCASWSARTRRMTAKTCWNWNQLTCIGDILAWSQLLHSCTSPKQKTPHISGELGCFFLAQSRLAALKHT